MPISIATIKENGKDIYKLRIPKPCEPEIKRVKLKDLDNYL